MWITYIDDAGDSEQLPNATTDMVTPVFAIGAVAFEQACLHDVTMDFLALKRRFFPHLQPATPHLLDWVRPEIKGAELRKMARSRSRNERRTASTFIEQVIRLLESKGAKVFGRVWIKGIAAPIRKEAILSFSIQDCCATFQQLLAATGDTGLIVVDSSSPRLNAGVSHSVFTQKFQAIGDAYDRIVEMPTFGHSENHVGLQIADILASGLLFPIATHVYCTGTVTSVHVNPRYSNLKTRFAPRLKLLQHRYYGTDGRRRGGIVISDGLGARSGGAFFAP